ncbi:MAG TPA: hypothetical protein VFT22_13325 [Kofleriaceae bacterium]|nr:hypothetical protein [Kofleriaceae bacterium]
MALGFLVWSACSGAPGDPGDASEITGQEQASSFEILRGFGRDGRGHHGVAGPAVHRALRGAAARLSALQADAIGDNARNGLDDADPDDGGWDFIVSPAATAHTAAASPTNLFGATGLGVWAALDTGSAGNRALVTALGAAAGMQGNPDVDSAPDFVFAVLIAELADNPGFTAVARAHYDAKRAAFGGAAGLGAFIRDARHAGREDGLIPYDLGWFVLAAAALDAAFPGAGYRSDADTFAQIVVDDLGSATPRFDLADPREEFYVTGLAWAQVAAAWVHAQGLLVQARAHLLAEQHADGAWGTSANQPADDLQSTAHALQTLALTDREARGARAAERRAARWLLNGQAASGGWSDASGVELPLVDADIALGLMLAETEAGEDALPGAPFAAHQPASGRPAVRAAPQP